MRFDAAKVRRELEQNHQVTERQWEWLMQNLWNSKYPDPVQAFLSEADSYLSFLEACAPHSSRPRARPSHYKRAVTRQMAFYGVCRDMLCQKPHPGWAAVAAECRAKGIEVPSSPASLSQRWRRIRKPCAEEDIRQAVKDLQDFLKSPEGSRFAAAGLDQRAAEHAAREARADLKTGLAAVQQQAEAAMAAMAAVPRVPSVDESEVAPRPQLPPDWAYALAAHARFEGEAVNWQAQAANWQAQAADQRAQLKALIGLLWAWAAYIRLWFRIGRGRQLSS